MKRAPYELPDGDFVKFIEQIHKQALKQASVAKAQASARLNAGNTNESPQETLQRIREQHQKTMQALKAEAHGEATEILQAQRGAQNKMRADPAPPLSVAAATATGGTPYSTTITSAPAPNTSASTNAYTAYSSSQTTSNNSTFRPVPPVHERISSQAFKRKQENLKENISAAMKARQESLTYGSNVSSIRQNPSMPRGITGARTGANMRATPLGKGRRESLYRQERRLKKLQDTRSALLAFWIFLMMIIVFGFQGHVRANPMLFVCISAITCLLCMVQIAIGRLKNKLD